MKTLPRALLALVCLLSAGIQAAAAKDPPLLSLSAAHFKETATVQEDPKADVVTISTENGYSEHTGLLRTVWSDEFLRAVIDPKAGRTTFEVVAWVLYSGTLRSYDSASYSMASGARSMPTRVLSRTYAQCSVGECSYTERVSFPIDEESLRQLAAPHTGDKTELWHFALLPRSGPRYAGTLSTAEMAGLLAKVDEYAHAPRDASPEVRVSPARDLGINGLAVDASADAPQRVGVLITAVTPGGMAHKAGLIVGDIIIDINGHAIKSMSDLSAAVSSLTKTPAAAIKVYRGTNEMKVTLPF